MLVLTRRNLPEQSDVVLHYQGVRIVVRVIDVRLGAVRLAFDAPQEVKILRGELEEYREQSDSA